MAANRIGKTQAGSFEMASHLTLYPGWWSGKRFPGPGRAWACCTTSQTTCDIVQVNLLGPEGARSDGMLPPDTIERITFKPGMPHPPIRCWSGTPRVVCRSYR